VALLDWIAVALLVVSMLLGLFRGLVFEVMLLTGWVVAFFCAQWLADESRTTYLFDVRTPEEFAAGSLSGAVHAPGGQLVQSTDQWVGTRGARMLLADSDGLRAVLMSSWLRQMGHDASVLVEGVSAKLAARTAAKPNLPELATISPAHLDGATVIDLRGSVAYRAAHAAGAIWSIRPRIAKAAAGVSRVALIADDPVIARAAALDLHEAGVKSVLLLQGAALTVSTSDDPPDVDCIDFLFFTHGRHEGNREAALQYLNWEVNLVKELDAAELGAFKISAHH